MKEVITTKQTDRKKKLEEGPNQQAVSLSRSVDTTVQGFIIKGHQPETVDYYHDRFSFVLKAKEENTHGVRHTSVYSSGI